MNPVPERQNPVNLLSGSERHISVPVSVSTLIATPLAKGMNNFPIAGKKDPMGSPNLKSEVHNV